MNEDVRERIKCKAVRKQGKKIYYFNRNGIYTSFPVEKIVKGAYLPMTNIHFRDDGSFWYSEPNNCYDYGEYVDGNVVKMAYKRMKEGDTFERLEQLFKTCKPAPKGSRKLKEIDRFICGISKPIYTRIPENLNERTFDFIHVDVYILSENAIENREQYLKDHIEEIKEKVLNKIEKSAAFKKYNVPINILKLSKITLYIKQSYIEMIFELKELSC